MNLQQTISKITGLNVTEDEAMAYARDNFGILQSHIAANHTRIIGEQNARIKELETENKHLKEQLEISELEREQQETESDRYYKHLNNALMYIPSDDYFHTEVLQALGGKKNKRL